MKKALFFGDSNTYGYDPAGFMGGRYPRDARWTTILEQDLADFRSQFDSCAMQTVHLAKAFVPDMIAQKYGRIVAINTECAALAEPGVGAYTAGKRALVVYFSRADENYVVGNVEKGNTRILAEMIAEATGADTFEIKPAKPYPKEYTPATEVAKQEKNDNARPEIVGTMPDVSGYDVVFVGYPIWWGDLPMPCYTFFDKVKLEGKTIAPFCTHEGSGQGRTVSEIAASAPNAELLEGIAIQGKVAQEDDSRTRELLTEWLGELKLIP